MHYIHTEVILVHFIRYFQFGLQLFKYFVVCLGNVVFFLLKFVLPALLCML